MGNFDDVLALEDGDDWDGYDPTAEVDAVAGLPPTVARLETHGVGVRLHGDVPESVLAAFAHLRDGRPVSSEIDLVFEYHHHGDPDPLDRAERPGRAEQTPGQQAAAGRILDRGGHVRAVWATDDDAVGVARQVVIDTVRSRDDHVVRLTAAVLAEDGDPRHGLVLLHPDDAVRHRLVQDLAEEHGCAVLSADELLVIPGSRTAYGTPWPTGDERVDNAARIDHAALRRVVFIDTDDGPAGSETMSLAEGVAAWLHADPSLLQRYGPGVLDVLVTVTRNAEFRRVRADSVQEYIDAALTPNTGEVPSTALVTLHRFDPPTAAEGPSLLGGPRHSLRVARIDEGGLLLEGSSGVVTVLDGDEIGAIEAAATTPPGRGRSAPPTVGDERFARLGELGVDLSVIHGRPSEAEAYALPNSALASSATAQRPGRSSSPGVDVLAAALRAARERDIEPIVLGAIVVAHDSTAPAAAVEVDHLDLLIEHSELGALAAALDAASFQQRGNRADSDQRPGSSALTLVAPGDLAEEFLVHLHVRLAAGPFSELVDHDEVRARAVPILVRDLWCSALHPVDRFVQACIRFQQRGADQRIAREVVLSAPRMEPLMAEALEASERWGSRRDVLEAMRRVDAALPGLSPWLVERATRQGTDRRALRRRRR